MGAGIAQVAAQAGFETVGREVTDELCERARRTIEHYLGRGVEKGKLTAEARDAALGRLTLTTNLEDLAGCAVDDLMGWTERKNGEEKREPGILDGLGVRSAEAEGIVMAARRKIGWIKDEEPVEADGETA